MEYKTFIAPNDWFSMEIPAHWNEYEDESIEEGSHAFFNTKEWTGNFRITPLKVDSENKNIAAEHVRKMRHENPEYKLFKINDFDCAFNKQSTKSGEDIIYFWYLGAGRDLIICSFTISKEMEGTEKTESELKTITRMLESIKL